MLVERDSQQQPVIVVAGVCLPEQNLTTITREWIELKTRFYPSVAKYGHGWLDAILHDIKGAKVRRGFRRQATTRQRRQAIGLIDGVLKLLERHDGRIVGRVWVKRLDMANKDMSIHGASLQFICSAFDAGLPRGERGMVVVDSQTYQHNHRLAHSVFTQRFGRTPKHCGLVDMPVFGHSDNHAGLQIADFMCSAILAPIACAVYAGGYANWNAHCDSRYLEIRERFGGRLQALTFRCKHPQSGVRCSSVIVNDPIRKRASRLMWVAGSAPRRHRPTGRTRQTAGRA
jgi:hypothetical protein